MQGLDPPAVPSPLGDPGAGPSAGAPRWRLAAVVGLVAFAVHAHTLGAGLVWDDVHHVQQNAMVRSLANVPRMFATDQWAGGTRDTTLTPYYRPVYKLSFAVDHALWGERPFGYHLTSLLLHVAASVLVLLFVADLAGAHAAGAGLVAGLVFAVHPVHSEAVAWISARNELLCAVFMLLSLRAYHRWRASGRPALLVASLAAFFVSLLGKEMSITLPALVLFLDPPPRRAGLRAWGAPGGYALVALAYLALRTAVLPVLDWGDGAPLWHRVLTAPDVVARYLRLLAWPANLELFYQVPLQTSVAAAGVLLPLLALVALAVAAVAARRWEPRVAVAVGWMLVTLAPVSGIPAELVPARMADRYLYVPSIGFALLCGALADRGWRLAAGVRWARAALVAGVALWTGWLGVTAFRRDRIWADPPAFTRAWVQAVPEDAMARVALGVQLEAEGDDAGAEREYATAKRLDPRYVESYANLGVLYDRQGRLAEAEEAYAIALRLDPRNPEITYNVGVHALQLGRFAEALEAFQATIALNPSAADAHYNLGLLHDLKGERALALSHLETAARLDPASEPYRAALEAVRASAAAHR